MGRIRLLVSDVDGTLVTSDKTLTEDSRRAVRRLNEAGIAFTVTSSRPPFGLKMLIEPLDLTLPMGAFNGAMIVRPDLEPLEQRLIPEAAGQKSLEMLAASGVDAWMFTQTDWLVKDANGPYVERERRTMQRDPVIAADPALLAPCVAKIVGVSGDFDRLAACEVAIRGAIGHDANVVRSQPYYLDITARGVDKGSFVDAMAARLGFSSDEIATIGDMNNDVAMFRRSGLSIAMGNAPTAVQSAASETTLSNDENGLSAAIERFVLRS